MFLTTKTVFLIKINEQCSPSKHRFVQVYQPKHEHNPSVPCCCSGVSSHPFSPEA
ncbi:hypothetical protein HanPSC8_Chr14g0596861 [Helianthus annuus]|nr:hypothetical protein HanPSC8_Chr14g0596861 [Helianthus annuus]